MKKLIFFFIVASLIYSCKFADDGYSFHREYDNYTYLTSQKAAMYISGTPDTATSVRDVYAILYEEIKYTNNEEDSILIFGHCWSRYPNPKVVDSLSVKYMIDDDEDGNPDTYIDTLAEGSKFQTVLGNLKPETQYYARSFVITGKIVDGQIVYQDTAFNPNPIDFITDSPKNIWEQRAEFPNVTFKNAVSFVYNDEIYVTLGNDESGPDRSIYKYSQTSNQWTTLSTTYLGSEISGATAFVIKNVRTGFGTYHDYVYIGTGYTVDGVDTTCVTEMYRWNFEDEWVRLQTGSEFIGLGTRDAVGFSLNGIGYILGGKAGNGGPLADMYRFDPELTDEGHAQGTWTKITNVFPGGPRYGASCFVIENNAYVIGGRNEAGDYRKDLYMYKQTFDGNGSWARKQDFPGTGRSEGVGFAIENLGYFGTGVDGDSLRSDFWRYNPYINSWDQRAYFNGRRRAMAVGAGLKFGNNDFRGYLGTGRGYDQGDSYGGYESDFRHYRP